MANKLYGFPDPCQDPLVKNIIEAGARISAKPVVKKEPITPEMISSICSKYASPSANLSSLQIAALFITAYCAFLSYFFLQKKILPSRRVGYVMDGWFSERCMYVTPIRLDLLLNTNQISCCKGKWYVRRFDPDTVQNGHI